MEKVDIIMSKQKVIKEQDELKYMGLLIRMTEVVVESLDINEQKDMGIDRFVLNVTNYTENKEVLANAVTNFKKRYKNNRDSDSLKGLLDTLTEINKMYVDEVAKYNQLIQITVLLVRLFSENMDFIKPKLGLGNYTDEQLDAIKIVNTLDVTRVYYTILNNSEIISDLTSEGVIQSTDKVIGLLERKTVTMEEVLAEVDIVFDKVVEKMLKIISNKEKLETNKVNTPIGK